ncbi:hypothetical protein VKT23_020282 [Stygiomarasmius scandens]|uniref:Uncharacterized protein n=1 Tax=Marasmiellus scandens TaxID=2682957 RepID=A0ABR1IKP2_9AGAR
MQNYRTRRNWAKKNPSHGYFRPQFPEDISLQVMGNPFFERWELDFLLMSIDVFDWLDMTEGTGYAGISAMLHKLIGMRLTYFHEDIRKSMHCFSPVLTYDDPALDYRVD